MVLALVGIGWVVVRLASCTLQGSANSGTQDGQGAGDAALATSVSFCAVGDNLINEGGDYTVDLLGLADSWSGTVGDDKYDFTPIYAQLKKVISTHDIAFINQETTLGGNDEFEYSGYPAYNTPDQIAKAVAKAGFDVINCNSNHTYDTWTNSIKHAQKVWAQQKGIDVIGSYTSQEDRKDIRVVERNGLKIAFLSYSYGQNGYDQSDLPNDYYAVPFDKEKMAKEVARAKKLADAVVVYMHWGEENTHELSDEQREYASYLAGLGVDLTIGSHAHVIQPVEYVSRNSSSKEKKSDKMLCVYGLGDFVSGYTLPKTILSGMFTCDFVRNAKGEVRVKNPVWHGLVEHSDGTVDTVYMLSNYTDKLAQSNILLARVGENDEYATSDPLEWAKETTQDVIGDVIEVDV